MFQTQLVRRARFASAVGFVVVSLGLQNWASALPYQITLGSANIVGDSGSYGGFPSTNIVNDQTGPVSDSTSTYWLNADGGPLHPYITIDLGAAHQIGEIELFNTHNQGFGDRGTANFDILAGNSMSGGVITGPTVTLVSGTLPPANTTEPAGGIPGQVFSVADTGSYQFLEFQPLTVGAFNTPCCGANAATTSFGLNEIRVFGTPEPGSLVLLGLGGLGVGLVVRRRRRA